MFRHRVKPQTFRQNLRLAVFLSFTAGLVNICGLESLDVLTTNVTGHFAYFSAAIQQHDLLYALRFLLYIASFFAGAFVSSFIAEFLIQKGSQYPHVAPIVLEIILLLFVMFWGDDISHIKIYKELLAALLLFSMGVQNAIVTKISRAAVRTTHLTGLFTDLGIELSQMFYYHDSSERRRLRSGIGLRLAIIAFFFAGGICGGLLFLKFKLKTLLLACVILGIALVYTQTRIFFLKIVKKIK
jgi:uncharacterized membrane protein YoaK (UPF0700 family)